MRALTKLCGPRRRARIVGNPPLVTPIEDVLPRAEQDHLEEVVRRIFAHTRTLPRVSATCSAIGTCTRPGRSSVSAAWYSLLDPADCGPRQGDPLFLQFKEAQASVLEPFLGKSRYAEHGQRVVEGQRMMQAAPDIMLGWERIETIDGEDRDFYIRQLWDAKARRGRADGPVDWRPTDGSAAGRWREPTRARATGSRSRPTRQRRLFDRAWRRSRRRTPTRTSGASARSGGSRVRPHRRRDGSVSSRGFVMVSDTGVPCCGARWCPTPLPPFRVSHRSGRCLTPLRSVATKCGRGIDPQGPCEPTGT